MSPLYPRNNETIIESRFNVDFTVNYWIYKGLAKEKLILLTSLYGESFKLAEQHLHTPGSKVSITFRARF